ncbi:hypothetical protein [Almyronema epifaneia]|uniref:Uncharacterized protein n=1 Tax=Almyronema epifaneia S1 TaxID=2991925 RepID=A0ABW6IDS5_9CYAN
MSQPDSLSQTPVLTAEYIEAYAEEDAIAGRPNPRFKRSTIYCHKYLTVRVQQVGEAALTDAEWDLTLF